MNYIKIMSKGWAGYNGLLNIIRFENGVSTEPVPQNISDRIAAAVSIMPCNADGSDIENASPLGIQHRLIAASALRAPVANSLERQSEGEKRQEAMIDAEKTLKSPVETMYSREGLEEIADKEGIKGLRKIGDKWLVRGRAIPDLINEILAAQFKFEREREKIRETTSGIIRTATLPYEPEPEAVAAEPDVVLALGHPDLVEAYMLGNRVISGATLIDTALRKSGKSLTGWNALEEQERHDLILTVIEELEISAGARLEAITPELPEIPAVPEPDGIVQLTEGEAEAIVELDASGADTSTETKPSE